MLLPHAIFNSNGEGFEFESIHPLASIKFKMFIAIIPAFPQQQYRGQLERES
jgi:hypothetical protein